MSLYIGEKKYCAVMKVGVANQDIVITENGNYTAEEGYTGFGVVRVNLPEPTFDQITINPSTETQEFLPENDGFSKVIVTPVTNAIDANIKPENIKKDETILGVTGTFEYTFNELTIDPSREEQEFLPENDGFSKVTVNAVTADIDENIKAANIIKGAVILGVEGTAIESNTISTRNITANGTFTADAPYTGFSSVVIDVKPELEELHIVPTIEDQVFTNKDEYSGFSVVTVDAITSDIDEHIIPENIRKGITILGVEGNIDFEELTIDPMVTEQILTPSVDGFSKVTVNPVTHNIDANIQPENIMTGVTILGVEGNISFEEITVTPSTQQQILTPQVNGFSQITVEPVLSNIDENIVPENIRKGVTILGVEGNIDFEEITITQGGEYTPTKDGFSKVIVDVTQYTDRISQLEADLEALKARLDEVIAGE